MSGVQTYKKVNYSHIIPGRESQEHEGGILYSTHLLLSGLKLLYTIAPSGDSWFLGVDQ